MVKMRVVRDHAEYRSGDVVDMTGADAQSATAEGWAKPEVRKPVEERETR